MKNLAWIAAGSLLLGASPARAGIGGVAHFAHPAQSDASAGKPELPGEAMIQEGLSHLKKSEFALAIEAFKQAADARQDGGAYFLLGYAYYARGFAKGTPEAANKQDAREAVAAYQKSLS